MLKFEPLTPGRWEHLEELFGARGACGGCWCMWWRLKRTEYERGKGAPNRRAMKKLVDSGEIPGILAYEQNRPVAWCSVAPRERFSALARSRSLKPIDASAVWSIVCLFVLRDHRGRGLSVKLIRAAARYVKSRGGRLVEAYPVHPRRGRMPDAFAWTGLTSAYLSAGFHECARPSATRRIVRLEV